MYGRHKALLWSAIPPLAAALFIAFYGTDVPFWDEWDLGPLIEKVARHQATFADFFEPQQEHRFVLPKLILVPLALTTHWNVIVELWLSFAAALAGYAGLCLLIRRGDTWRFVITSLAYFSLSAYENWLWGWQFSWFLTNALLIWAVVAAGSITNRVVQIAVAALLCVLATFSAAHGIASWLALAPLLWLPVRNDERRVSRVAAIATWAVLFAMTLGIYLYRFHPRRGGFAAGSIARLTGYALTVIGSPLSRTIAIAIAAGIVLVMSFAIAVTRAWRLGDREGFRWIAIGLFGIGFAALNAVGRSGLGFSQALSSRYLTPASLVLIAVINLEFPQRFRRLLFMAVAAALVMQSLTSILIGRQIKRTRDEGRVCLDLFPVNDSSDCIAGIAGSDAMLRDGALAVHRTGVRPLVTESNFMIAPRARGSVDAVTPLSPTAHPALTARGHVELPSRGLFAVVATVEGTRRIVAADLVRGQGSVEWTLVLPPHIVQRNSAFEVWLFVPAGQKLYRLEQRLLRPNTG